MNRKIVLVLAVVLGVALFVLFLRGCVKKAPVAVKKAVSAPEKPAAGAVKEKAPEKAASTAQGKTADVPQGVVKVPGPELIEPGDTLEIRAGEEKIKVSWKPGEAPDGIYAFFVRIYKGSQKAGKQQVEVTSKEVSGKMTEMELPAKNLKAGETYTLFLKQINNVGKKLVLSEPVHHVFTVKKATQK